MILAGHYLSIYISLVGSRIWWFFLFDIYYSRDDLSFGNKKCLISVIVVELRWWYYATMLVRYGL